MIVEDRELAEGDVIAYHGRVARVKTVEEFRFPRSRNGHFKVTLDYLTGDDDGWENPDGILIEPRYLHKLPWDRAEKEQVPWAGSPWKSALLWMAEHNFGLTPEVESAEV